MGQYGSAVDELLFEDPKPQPSKPGTYGDVIDDMLAGPPDKPETEEERQQRLQGYSDIYTPTLQGAGATAGGVIGLGAGAPSGPGAAVTAAAGGTGGYMIGDRAAKTLDEVIGIREKGGPRQWAEETGTALREGATYEMGGQAAGVILTPVWRGGKLIFKTLKEKSKEWYRARAAMRATKKADIPPSSASGRAFTAEGVRRKARNVLVANTTAGPIYAKNAKEAAAVEDAIPGLKFTMGQRANDPALIQLERSQTRRTAEAAAEFKERQLQNSQAITRYYKQQFPEAENIDDLIGILRQQQEQLGRKVEQAVIGEAAAVGKIPAYAEKHYAGRAIEQVIEDARGPVQSVMGELEAAIPDYPMEFNEVRKAIFKAIRNPKLSAGQIKSVKNFEKQFDELAGRGESTHRAFGVRRTLNDEINKAYSQGNDSTAAVLLGIKESLEKDLGRVSAMGRTGKMAEYQGKAVFPDELAKEYERNATRLATLKSKQIVDTQAMAQALGKKDIPTMKQPHEGEAQYTARITRDYERLIGGEVPIKTQAADKKLISELTRRNKNIQTILQKVEPGQDVAAAMNAYNQFASSEYFGKFDVGAVKQAGRTGTKPENIPAMFKGGSGTGDLIRAVGWSRAQQVMKGYYSYDLYHQAADQATGRLVKSKLSKWFHTNKAALKKLDLLDQFRGVEKAQNIVNAAQQEVVEFEKSAAARLLKADPKNAIASALSGNAPAKAATELMGMVRGNPAATRGLQKALAEHMTTSIESTARDLARQGRTVTHAQFQKIMDKYGDAARVIYRNQPEKIRALETMRKAHEISTSNIASPLGGGSDTAQNIFSELGKMQIVARPLIVLSRAAYKTISSYSEEQINSLITRALFYPDMGDVLIRGARGKFKPGEFERALNAKIVQFGIGMAAAGTEEPPDFVNMSDEDLMKVLGVEF